MKTHLVLAVLTIAVAGGAAATADAKNGGFPANSVHVTAMKSGYSYDTKTVNAKAGPITVIFTNKSSRPHNVSLEQGETEYGATVTIGSGQTATILNLSKGTYHFYSSFGKDEDKGMAGTLRIS